MSGENKTLELKDEQLEQVTGGGNTCPDQLAIPFCEVSINRDVWALDTTNHVFRWGKVIYIDDEGLIQVQFGGGNVLTSEGIKPLEPNTSWACNVWGAPF